MINKARRFLIEIGKTLPFVVCFLLTLHYSECLIALITESYLSYDGCIILYTPLSFIVGGYFEYNIQMLVVLFVISIAIETCYWNKLACLYLGINLLEKSYFNFEMDVWLISVICTLNIITSGFFVYKGAAILLGKR